MKYIAAYNPDWPKRFEQIAAYVKAFLPEGCTIHHVGSTSVPGMPAKDIIDIDVEYTHGFLQAVIDGLKDAGYEHQGDLGIPGREAFKPVPDSRAASLPAHHLYACEAGAPELKIHLAFRDYLRAHPGRAEWLGKKKILVDASAKSRDEYMEKKGCYYEPIVQESMEWVGRAEQGTETGRGAQP
jgi:GrpB-like predicted nucleotidyltransferase (UPF0157 family)